MRSKMRWSDSLKKAVCLCLACMLVLLSGALAEDIDVSRTTTLKLGYAMEETPVPNARFALYRVADVDAECNFTLSGDFSGYPVQVNGLKSDGWRNLAATLDGYVKRDNPAPIAEGTTDVNGRISFGNLSTGLYLLVGDACRIGNKIYTTGATMVSLPSLSVQKQWQYDVNLAPKASMREVTPVRIEVRKVWDDKGAEAVRPTEISAQLLKDGAVVETVTLSIQNNWWHEWTNLDGEAQWQVVENSVPGYTVTVNREGELVEIINHRDPLPTPTPTPTPEGQTPTPPVPGQSPTPTPEGQTPTPPVPGESPTPTPEGQTPTPTPTRAPRTTPTPIPTPTPTPTPTPKPTISVAGEKIWVDENNRYEVRPENVEIILYANGVATDAQPVWGEKTGDRWAFEFQNLQMLDENDQVIVYTVGETPVQYYEASINGTVITNELIPQEPSGYTEVAGTKRWRDNDNELGYRPESVVISLLQNDVVIEERIVSEQDGWQYTFAELPLDDGYGHSYTYAIREKMVNGYITKVDGYDVINTLIPNAPPPETPDDPNSPDDPENPDSPDGPGTPPTPRMRRTPPFSEHLEEELEEFIEIFDYDVPLWGGLLGTGDEMPIYPFVFAGIGAAAVMILLVFGRRKRARK